MDLLRFALVVSVAFAGGCGNDSEGDTDTDTDGFGTPSGPSSPSSPSSDTFDPPDTFPDTFDDDDDPSLTDSDPTADPTNDPSTDPSTPTASDSASESESASASDTDTDTTDTDTTDTDTTDTDTTDTADPTDPTGDPPPDGGTCCDVQDAAPGCDDNAVTSCVCAEDPFCCDNEWDETCVVAVVIYGCGTCDGVGGEGDCCAANGTPGCDDNEIEACVCAADSICCLEGWDETCAEGVEFEECGTCPG